MSANCHSSCKTHSKKKAMLMVRHDFHWLEDGEHEVPTVRSLGVRLSKLSVEGETEDGELAHGEICNV